MSIETKTIKLLNLRQNRETCTKRGLALFKVTGSHYQCLVCGEHFAGPVAFGHHRVDAACLSPDGMRDLGMAINRAGFWAAQQPQEATS